MSDPLKPMAQYFDLPRAVFEDDYQARLAAAQDRYQWLLARIRQLEAEDPETWLNMPWSTARAEWEAREGHLNQTPDDPRLIRDQWWSTPALTPLRLHLTWTRKNQLPEHRERVRRCGRRRAARLRAARLARLAAYNPPI